MAHVLILSNTMLVAFPDDQATLKNIFLMFVYFLPLRRSKAGKSTIPKTLIDRLQVKFLAQRGKDSSLIPLMNFLGQISERSNSAVARLWSLKAP